MQLGRFAAILIRGKDEIHEEIGRSPDKGDSVAQTFPRVRTCRDLQT